MAKVLRGGKTPKMVRRKAPGWSKKRTDAFIAELAATCNVSAAAKEAGISVSAVYARRRREAAFRTRWAEALAEGYARLELMLLERAMNGVVKEMRRPDGGVDKTIEYNDRTALALLRMHRDKVEAHEEEVPPAEIAAARERVMRKLARMQARVEGEAGGGDAVAGIEAEGGGAADAARRGKTPR